MFQPRAPTSTLESRHKPRNMSADLPKYKYEPLKPASCDDGEMRLLTLLSGLESSSIRCRLDHVPLNTREKYHALSYTWGDPKSNDRTIPVSGDPDSIHAITINGRRAMIGYNLGAALLQLRHVEKDRVLWVDALCIDQNNDGEKSEQFRVMGQIYKQAERIVAWLGEHDDYVDMAFDTLEQIFWTLKALIYQRCAEDCKISPKDVTHEILERFIETIFFDQYKSYAEGFLHALSLFTIDFVAAPASMEELAADTWARAAPFVQSMLSDPLRFSELPDLGERLNAVNETFNHKSFWQRIWIFQELIQKPAVIVRCGSREMNLMATEVINHTSNAVIRRLFGWTEPKGHKTYRFLDTLRLLLFKQYLITRRRSYDSSDKSSDSLATMILHYAYLQCSEPRDAIYASLNVSRPINISLDYKKPVATIYTEATRAMIDDEKSLNIVFVSDERDFYVSNDFGLPAWVPHFEKNLISHDLYEVTLPYDSQGYCAGGEMNSAKKNLPLSESRILQLHGCFYGEVKEAGIRIHTPDATALIKMA